MSGGVGGLMNFGKQQAVSNATTAVAYNIDKTFRPRVRITVQVNYQGRRRAPATSRTAPPTSRAIATPACASSARATPATG